MRSTLSVLFLACLSVACTSTTREPIADPRSDVAHVGGIDREGGEGPYLAGSTETFQLQFEGEAPQVLWSASAGVLNASGTRVTWKLPEPGIATLTAQLKDAKGEEKTLSWSFQILSTSDSLAVAREALLTNPISVGDAGTADFSGSVCQIAYDATNKIHLAWRNDTHPSLWYGVWNGSTWSIELVDGMGFNRGGMVSEHFSMVLDGAGNPHFGYFFQNSGYQAWYATKSGGTWTRERVDSTYPPYQPFGSLALNPAQSNRPTFVYQQWTSGSSARSVVAERTAPGTWTQNRVYSSASGGTQTIRGDALFDAGGTLYFTFANYLAVWTPTTYETYGVGTSLNADWTNLAWETPGSKLLIRTSDSIARVSLGTPLNTSTSERWILEESGSTVGDLIWSGKPYVLHRHGSNLELVTTDAQNYFTYTQLGTVSGASQPAVTVNASGVASLCYRSLTTGQITFQ